jgi:glycosyltransferase involved in cell wall biosynthesis
VPAYSYGGPLKVCFDISKELVNQGHAVTVATTDTLDGKHRIKKQEEEIDGIEIIRFKNVSNDLAKNYNGYLPIGFYSWVKKNIKNYDVVHCHDFFTLQNIVISHFCKKYKIPFIVQPHGSAVPKKSRGREFIKIFFNLFWGKNIIRNAKHVIALTEEEGEDIEKYFSVNTIRVIPNGIGKSNIFSTIDIRKKYRLSEDSILITSLARLHKIKGFDLLIEAFAIFLKKFPDSFLFIVGPDEGELPRLKKITHEKRLEKNILFTGLLVGDEKFSLLSQSNLFALFSHNDPFPMAVLEALESGTPVVLSDKIGIASIIEKKGAGKITNPLDRELSSRVLENSILDLAHLKSNTKNIKEFFSISNAVKNIINLYTN